MLVLFLSGIWVTVYFLGVICLVVVVMSLVFLFFSIGDFFLMFVKCDWV